ncbi:AAA family ATPase [Streptomyces europaeiscabiei]|uniref:AAA family ATPase n=1 Tax=Streptomyces europaeiscabiei TaxID=146819 RepID=UPI00069C6D1C|nr:AAA family ATPase [Streptomyces europaeiscabiei]
MARSTPWAKETIDGYISTMIGNVAGLDGKDLPEADLAYLVGRFLDEDGREKEINRRSLSDGTLRLAGVLAALFQSLALSGSVPFIGIEAPEVSLYPPMLGALYDAFVGASHNMQVMVTTQSSDLLVVRADSRGSTIGPIDETGQCLLTDGMPNLPELLRSGEMRPEPTVPHNTSWYAQ